jgi:hypothetical protein
MCDTGIYRIPSQGTFEKRKVVKIVMHPHDIISFVSPCGGTVEKEEKQIDSVHIPVFGNNFSYLREISKPHSLLTGISTSTHFEGRLLFYLDLDASESVGIRSPTGHRD